MNELRTTDLYVAAYALASGHELRKIEKGPNDRRATFILDVNDADPAAIKESFFNGATIEARKFTDSIKDLKNRIYA